MGLVNTIDLLNHAEKHSYAVGAFNVINLEFLNGVLEAAEAVKSPVIINIAEAHFTYVNMEEITPAIKYMVENVCVPVVLNLDHGMSIETVVRALRCGFSAVMYDASKKPLDQNIEETKLIVKMAHSVGVSVEAELGRVGGAEGGGGVRRGARAKREFFTNPDDAERYVAETGIDALAVSVGNVHGFYEGDPELEFDLIGELKRRTGIPLVLHGGSGISDDDFRRAISLGIRKINFFTEMSKMAADRVAEMLRSSEQYLIHDLLKGAQERMQEVATGRMQVFGSAGTCSLPGNVCKSEGSCGCGRSTGSAYTTVKAQTPYSADSSVSEAELADIVSRVVTEFIKKDGK